MPTNKEIFNGKLNALADRINSKAGASGQKDLDEMYALAGTLSKPTGTVSITANGTVDVTQYASASVNVPNSYSSSDEGKVVSNGALVAQTSRSVTANGTYDTTTNDSVTVNVPTGAALLDYTVTFSADGSDYYIASCLDGDKVTAPPNPTKTGYAFMGWFTGEGGSGTKVTFPYTPSGDTTFYAHLIAARKATVTGVGSSSPSAVTFDVDDGFTVAGIGIEGVTMGGDTFIKIPTMYRKVNTVVRNQITSFTISTAALDNTYQPYSVFVDENGNLLEYVLIGKYWNSSSSNMISQSQSGAVSMTIGDARTFARARGTGYQQYDWQFQKLWQDLIVVFKRTYDTNAGAAWTYDAMGIYWGTNSCWIDGICHNSAVIAVSDKPSKYVDSATTSTDGYFGVSYNLPTSSGVNITKLGYDSSHPFVNYPSAASGSSYTSYYCDGYYYSSGSHPVRSLVGDADASYGAFSCLAAYVWSNTFSARLCYRPLPA